MTGREATLPDRIREAVASDEFEKALVLWNEYTGRLQEELQQHRLTAARLQEMGGLVEWSSSVLISARQRARDLLGNLCAAGKYADAAPPRNEPRIVQLNL
jgi:hypothetical protein